ncbi:MAG: hypothetical protein NVS3B8_06030 [Chitinophagaceae bacterium]
MSNYKTIAILMLFSIVIIFYISCTSNNGDKKVPASVKNTAALITTTLSLKSAIKLPGVTGGFDLMAIDTKEQRLFLAAEDNHSLEVIDIKKNQALKSIPGFNEPKWVVFRPESNRLYVSTGGDGKVTVLDATTYKVITSFLFKEKCNNLRFDTATQQLYVGVGKSFGSIGIIDVKNDKVSGEIPLSDFPKQFELNGNRIYVNIPSKNSIEVIDRPVNKVMASWPVTGSSENVPMVLDRIHHRLFVACEPGKFIVYNTETGKPVANLAISKNADGIYLDAEHSLIYISCGEGFIEVIGQKDADNYMSAGKIPTVQGAGTSLFSPALHQLFLAVPQSKNRAAELRVYETAN